MKKNHREPWPKDGFASLKLGIPENGEIPPTVKPIMNVSFGGSWSQIKEVETEETNINQATMHGYLVFEHTCPVCGLSSSRIVKNGEHVIGFLCVDEKCSSYEDDESMILVYNAKKIEVPKYRSRW